MKRFLKILLIGFIYSVEIEKEYYSELRKETRWKFVFHARIIPMTLICILIVPFIFIMKGIIGVREGWNDIYKDQNYSSFRLWGKTKPSKIECYAKF